MTVVVDVGCNFYESHPNDESVNRLIAEHKPDWLYGFDPLSSPIVERRNGTGVTIEDKAAWVFDGELHMGIGAGGLSATLMPDKQSHGEWNTQRLVRCFDFARWLMVVNKGWGHRPIVKLDVEGAEVPLLEALVKTGADRLITLLRVEWHGHLFDDAWREREEVLRGSLNCPVETW